MLSANSGSGSTVSVGNLMDGEIGHSTCLGLTDHDQDLTHATCLDQLQWSGYLMVNRVLITAQTHTAVNVPKFQDSYLSEYVA